MRTCVSCGDVIPDKKRKDAKYCDKAACRGREYRKRQAEAQTSEGKPHAHTASTVLTCACGRRYKIQISAIEGPEVAAESARSLPETSPAALTETVSPTAPAAHDLDGDPKRVAEAAQAFTETVSHTAQASRNAVDEAERRGEIAEAFTETVSPTVLPASTTDNGPELEAAASGAITQAVLLTNQQPAQSPSTTTAPTSDAQALTQTDRGAALPSGLVTLELRFVRGLKQRIPLQRAVQRRSGGRWALQPETRAVFSIGDGQRSSLGGRPGAWAHVYGERSPIEYGYDADLVVMFWDHNERRGRVAKTSLLRDILGAGWKAKLREQAGRT